ncbi:MAG: hypothetical protein UY72_C0022G0007 [Candidatus Uhrbacteria bacterium GW2011_GWD2_52_7]|uniref:Uncharacterized protein n=1 Tax=Candidatus Uhrbacteria bacterium GW2011_GWD2_52_7 TaxID=1618989 RepID=A0A0G1XFU2_9BACT|nr:MAG: hypothetical protein UY72_C0022G0007 [Candidatus Uhrbacteria bacterium GW2011_GWD2_52_7]
MKNIFLVIAVGVVTFITGVLASYFYLQSSPSIFAPSWPDEQSAQNMLDAYLSMDVFGGPDGEFIITKTDFGSWVILKQ